MKEFYSITIDIGTTNTKISLFNKNTGQLVRRSVFKTKKIEDEFGDLFDFNQIWDSLKKEIIDFVNAYPDLIDIISISSVGEAGILLNKDNEVVTPMIAWYDQRASSYINNLTDEEKKIIYSITGLPAHSNYSLPKIKWLVDSFHLNQHEEYIWLNIPDYLSFILTNEMKTEYSMASRTMCLSIEERSWSQEILEIFSLDNIIKFPEIVNSGDVIGYTDNTDIGVISEQHIGVTIAGHDHMVGAFGVHLDEKTILNSTGTTEGLLLLTQNLNINEKNYECSLTNGIFVKPDYYTLFSSIPTGGEAFNWFTELFDIDANEFEELCSRLYDNYMNQKYNLHSTSILIPHLSGSGAPFKNSTSKGLLYNLDIATTKEDILFAIVMGLVLELKYVKSFFDDNLIERMTVIGPATRNKLWLQMKADALNLDVYAISKDEIVSLGAYTTTLEQDVNYSGDKIRYQPIENNVRIYNELLEVYEEYYNFKKEITLNS